MIKTVRRPHYGADEAAYRLLRTFLFLQHHRPLPTFPPDPTANWNALLPKIRQNYLRPLAYWTTRELRLELPAELRRQLEGAFFGAALRIEQIEGALAAVDAAFSAIHVQAIVLKGLVLARTLYPLPACRPMEDIDLLVRKPDFARAGQALESLGYSDKAYGMEDFRDPVTGVDVDLHAECLNANRVHARRRAWSPDLEDLWRRSQPFQSFHSLRILDPADHLVYLCHHAWLHHGLRRPLALLDIALLFRQLSQSAADERRFEQIDGQARRALWYALWSCHWRFAPLLSESLQNALRPRNAGPLERLIHTLAIRGRLPECARYMYLWFAIPPRDRPEYLRQIFPAGWRMASSKRGIEMGRAQSNSLTDL